MGQLLDLPSNVILLIVDILPHHGKFRIAQTCRSLQKLAMTKLYETCFVKFSEYADTFIVYPGVEDSHATVDYLEFEKHRASVRHLQVCYYDLTVKSIWDTLPVPLFVIGPPFVEDIVKGLRSIFTPELVQGFRIMSQTPEMMNGIQFPASQENIFDLRAVTNLTKGSNLPISHLDFQNQLELLAPGFTNLKRFDLGSRGYPPLKLQIRALQLVLENCSCLEQLKIELFYNGPKELNTLTEILSDDEYKLKDSQAYPKLTKLSLTLRETEYDEALKPTYCLLDVLCGLVVDSAKTVNHFEFEFGFTPLRPDSDAIYQARRKQLPRNSGAPMLDLRNVEKAKIGFGKDELSETIASEYFHFDNMGMKELDIANLVLKKDRKNSAIEYIKGFPNIEIIQLSYPYMDFWVFGFLDAIGKLGSFKELRLQVESCYAEECIDFLAGMRYNFGPECSVKCVKRPNRREHRIEDGYITRL